MKYDVPLLYLSLYPFYPINLFQCLLSKFAGPKVSQPRTRMEMYLPIPSHPILESNQPTNQPTTPSTRSSPVCPPHQSEPPSSLTGGIGPGYGCFVSCW